MLSTCRKKTWFGECETRRVADSGLKGAEERTGLSWFSVVATMLKGLICEISIMRFLSPQKFFLDSGILEEKISGIVFLRKFSG